MNSACHHDTRTDTVRRNADRNEGLIQEALEADRRRGVYD